MRAVVVYESMYGNTHVIATNIAAGLRDTHEVTLVSVSRATPDLIAGADLLVVGAPTHLHGLSTASSRQAARKAAGKPDSGLELDPDAGGPALREWLGRPNRRAYAGRRLRHPAGWRPRADRPGQPRHQQAAQASRVRPHRAAGELRGHQAEHPGRRGVLAGPPVGRGARGSGRVDRPCRLAGGRHEKSYLPDGRNGRGRRAGIARLPAVLPAVVPHLGRAPGRGIQETARRRAADRAEHRVHPRGLG